MTVLDKMAEKIENHKKESWVRNVCRVLNYSKEDAERLYDKILNSKKCQHS